MRVSGKNVRRLAVVCGAVVSIGLVANCAGAKDGETKNPVVMTVNGSPVTQTDIDRVVALLQAQMPGKHLDTPAMQQKSEEAARDKMVEFTLLYEAGLKAPPADLDKKLEAYFMEKRNKFTTVPAFENSLKKLGMTEADYRAFLRKELIVNNYVQTNFIDKVNVKEEEIADFYARKKDGFKTMEESRKVSQIFVAVPPGSTPEQKSVAREKAEKLRARVIKGEKFADVASKESGDASARHGGSLDFISKGQMPAPFEKAAYAMKRGDISEVVETGIGFHVIQLNDIKEAEYAPLAEVREKIRTYLKSTEAKKLLNGYLADLKAKAVIASVEKK